MGRPLKPITCVFVGCARQDYSTRVTNPFKPGGDIDAVAHQVAVALLHHVADMDSDAKIDALVRRDPSVPLYHRPLDFNGAVHRVDDTAELDDAAVAGALDDAPMVDRDGRIDQIAAQRPQPREDPILVRSGKPRMRPTTSDTKIAASFRVSLTAVMPKPDHRSQMARVWLHFHAARKGRGSGVQPRVSTGRSIHAVPSITPSPREGIEDGPRLRVRTRSNRAGRGRPEDLRARASAEIDVAAVTVEGSPQKPRNRENSAPFPCRPPPKPAIPACSARSSIDGRLRVSRSATLIG